MNQRNSSGLPLRAMVMVLLFLGVVFLLVGFQAMGSGDDSADEQPIVDDHQHAVQLRDAIAVGGGATGRRAGVQHLRDRRRRGRHGEPIARGRLERHRNRQLELAGRRGNDGVFQ